MSMWSSQPFSSCRDFIRAPLCMKGCGQHDSTVTLHYALAKQASFLPTQRAFALSMPREIDSRPIFRVGGDVATRSTDSLSRETNPWDIAKQFVGCPGPTKVHGKQHCNFMLGPPSIMEPSPTNNMKPFVVVVLSC